MFARNRDRRSKKNWGRFARDPEWQKSPQKSGIGRIKVDSFNADPTTNSPIKVTGRIKYWYLVD
jgi:hypothetical protein